MLTQHCAQNCRLIKQLLLLLEILLLLLLLLVGVFRLCQSCSKAGGSCCKCWQEAYMASATASREQSRTDKEVSC